MSVLLSLALGFALTSAPLPPPTNAQSQASAIRSLRVRNHADRSIVDFYIWPDGTSSLVPDVFAPGEFLESGYRFDWVSLNRACVYTIRLVFEDKKSFTIAGYDICKEPTMTILDP